MADAIVLDASVAVALVTGEPGSGAIGVLLRGHLAAGDGEIVVPELFWLEVTNVLIRRHGRSIDAVLTAIRDLDELGVRTVAMDRGVALLALDLSARLGLTAYDAAYMALAEVEDARLVTLDETLAAAAGARALVPGRPAAREARASYAARPARPPISAWADHGAFLARLRAEVSGRGTAASNRRTPG